MKNFHKYFKLKILTLFTLKAVSDKGEIGNGIRKVCHIEKKRRALVFRSEANGFER